MSSTSTVYDVKVKYALDDRASNGVKQIASATDKAAKSAFSLKSALAAVGGMAMLKTAKSALIDFNSEIDQMKIGMTTVMQMQLKMPFQQAREEAEKLFKVFQELAKKSPATTKDFMEMGNAIAPSVAMMGGGPGKIAKLAQGGVLASQAFGERADIVALDIKQMLAGTINARDRIAQQLIASRGLTSEKFNGMDSKARASMTESMLQDPALLKAADQMGASFKGQTSTFKDMMQITLGEVGLPLMQAMTGEVQKWNNWIEKHPKTIKDWVTSFSGALQSGFETMKSIASWFVDHQDILMSLAKAFVMFKGASIATNVFKSFTEGVAGLAKNTVSAATTLGSMFTGGASGSVGGVFSGLVGILGGAGGVIAGLTLFAGALGVVSTLLNTHAESDKKARDAAISLHEATGDYPGMRNRRDELKNSLKGQLDSGVRMRQLMELETLQGKLNDPEKLGMALRKISESSDKSGKGGFKDFPREYFLDNNFVGKFIPNMYSGDSGEFAKNMESLREVAGVMKSIRDYGVMDHGNVLDEILKHAFPEQFGMPTPKEATATPTDDWKGLSTKDVNVTIQKVEVASEDPDRFVFGMIRIAENGIRHATQSAHTIPGGF